MMENRNQAEQKEENIIMEEKKQKKQNEQIIRNTPVLPQDINEAKNTRWNCRFPCRKIRKRFSRLTDGGGAREQGTRFPCTLPAVQTKSF